MTCCYVLSIDAIPLRPASSFFIANPTSLSPSKASRPASANRGLVVFLGVLGSPQRFAWAKDETCAGIEVSFSEGTLLLAGFRGKPPSAGCPKKDTHTHIHMISCVVHSCLGQELGRHPTAEEQLFAVNISLTPGFSMRFELIAAMRRSDPGGAFLEFFCK